MSNESTFIAREPREPLGWPYEVYGAVISGIYAREDELTLTFEDGRSLKLSACWHNDSTAGMMIELSKTVQEG